MCSGYYTLCSTHSDRTMVSDNAKLYVCYMNR